MGREEGEGSGWGTHVYLWQIHFDIWQTQYNIVKLNKIKLKKKKNRGTRNQIANIRWIIENTREFQKSIYFCFIDYAKSFDCGDHSKL